MFGLDKVWGLSSLLMLIFVRFDFLLFIDGDLW